MKAHDNWSLDDCRHAEAKDTCYGLPAKPDPPALFTVLQLSYLGCF